jgi:hypothetical protein
LPDLPKLTNPGAHYTRFPSTDKADDRNVIGAIRPTKPAPAQWRRAIAGRLALCALLLGGLLCAARAQSDAPDWPATKPIRFEVVAAAVSGRPISLKSGCARVVSRAAALP